LTYGVTVTGTATTRSEPSGAALNATTCVLPPARPVTVPLASTVATDSFTDTHRAPDVPAIDASDAVVPTLIAVDAAAVNVVLPVKALAEEIVPVGLVPPLVLVVVVVAAGTITSPETTVGAAPAVSIGVTWYSTTWLMAEEPRLSVYDVC
jgi:hypothetical protein